MQKLSNDRLRGRAIAVRTLLEHLEGIGARLAVRLVLRQELIGILLVGKKRGREPFTGVHDRFLADMAAVAALALDDALAYDEIAALNRDLERRVAERTAELHAANDELRRATSFKSEFIRSVTHELRTPLNAILGFSTLVRERERTLAPQSLDELAKIQRGAQALLVLIEDLLDLGRIEAGRFQLRVGPCDLDAVARDAGAVAEPLARAKGLRLDVELPPLPLVETDAGRVRQILVNLLGNAVKFTPAGFVALRAVVQPELVELQVWDTGPGIPAAQAEAIFGEFVQLHQGDARQHQGTGLGLAIARKLARLLGGDVALKPMQGAGSCFVLRLPVSAGAPVGDRAPTPPQQQALPRPRRRVLAVSEDPETIVRLRELLGQADFDVAVAFDCEEAVAKARETAPFAIALDGKSGDTDQARRSLQAALGAAAPPAVVLPIPLDRDVLLAALAQAGR
jgi:signal transduction histidine kinase